MPTHFSSAPLALLILVMPAVAPCPAATISWKAHRSGDWTDDANWEGGKAPAAGDDVLINAAGARVLLSQPTSALASVTLIGPLTFYGWETTLTTTTLIVRSGGLITRRGPFKERAKAARVLIRCAGALTVEENGAIAVDGQRPGAGPGRLDTADNYRYTLTLK
jgi:hypothetical protein